MGRFIIILLPLLFLLSADSKPIKKIATLPKSKCIQIKTYEDYMHILHTTKNKLVLMDLGTKKSDAFSFLTPRLETAAEKFNEVVFIIVDYMDVPQIYWDIRCPLIPTLVVFYNGQVVDAFVSTWEPEVEWRIQKLLTEYVHK